MATRYLFYTNVILSWVRGNALGRFLDTTHRLPALAPGPDVSIVTVGELLAFGSKARWGLTKWNELARILALLTVHDVDSRFVDAYAEIDAASHAVGHKMGKNDLWLAATARVLGLTLLTTDKDFDHLNPTWVDVAWVDPGSKLAP